MTQSVYDNGGIIGTKMDFNTTELYSTNGSFTNPSYNQPLLYVGGQVANFATTSSQTVNFALTGGVNTAPRTGDIVIVGFSFGALGNESTANNRTMVINPTGGTATAYTTVADLYANSNSVDTNFGVFWKVMEYPADTGIICPNGSFSGSFGGTVAIQAWRGIANASSPFDTAANSVAVGGTVLVNASAITTSTDNCTIIVIGAGSHQRNANTYSSSDLSNFRTSVSDNTYDSTIGIGSYLQTSPGTFDPAQWTFGGTDSTNYSYAAVTMALKKGTIYTGNRKNSGIWNLSVFQGLQTGQAEYTTPGTYFWQAPIGVTNVSVVAIGGGGGGGYGTQRASGGAGGGLGWKNNIPVTPGEYYTVVVGAGGAAGTFGITGAPFDGEPSYFISNSTVAGFGGAGGYGTASYPGSITEPPGGLFVGDGGGNGGNSVYHANTNGASGGGGAGGYSGTGGKGGDPHTLTAATNGAGGGGGGGGYTANASAYSGGGGGVGLLGEGANGTAGTSVSTGSVIVAATGGSGGANGGLIANGAAYGGLYGGGGGAHDINTINSGEVGGNGAVRIIWGPGRAFPSTKTGNL